MNLSLIGHISFTVSSCCDSKVQSEHVCIVETIKRLHTISRQATSRMGILNELFGGLGKGVATEARLIIASGVSEGVCRSVW